MRRPLCFYTGAFLFGVFMVYALENTRFFIFGIGAFVLFLIFTHQLLEREIALQIFLILFCLFLGFSYMSYRSLVFDRFEVPEGENAQLKGTVISSEIKEGTRGEYCQFALETEEGERFLISCYDEGLVAEVPGADAEASEAEAEAPCAGADPGADVEAEARPVCLDGMIVEVDAELSLPQEVRNPGCFDYGLYLRSKGIIALGSCQSVRVVGTGSYLRRGLCECRRGLEQWMEPLGPEKAALLKGMLFGDKGNIEEADYEAFQRNGTAHVLAVSGLHAGVVYGVLAGLLRAVFGAGVMRRKWASLLVLCFMVFYAALSGFAPSVVRAVLMIGLRLMANVFDLRYDMLTGTALAALILIIYQPFYLFTVGFQLSFLAVTILAFLLPYLNKKVLPDLEEFLRMHLPLGLAENLSIGAKIFVPGILLQVALMPYVAYVFNYVSISAFFANIPMLFLAGIVVPFAMGSFLLGFGFLLKLTGALLWAIIWWNRISYNGGLLSFEIASPPLVLVLLFYATFFLLLSERFRIMKIRQQFCELTRAWAVLLLLVVSLSVFTATGFESADVIFADVGQGACVLIKGDDATVLIDAGGSPNYEVGLKTVRPFLLKNAHLPINYAVATHLDTDHYQGLVELCQAGMIENLILYEGLSDQLPEIQAATGLPQESIHFVSPGTSLNLGPSQTLTFIGPATAKGSDNDLSLVSLLDFNGAKILLTGDQTAEAESALLQYASVSGISLQCDILQVAHHGSAGSTTEAFLSATNPTYAVIQVGARNTYGHPSQSTLERLQNAGATILRTDQSGAIGFTIPKSGGIKVQVTIF